MGAQPMLCLIDTYVECVAYICAGQERLLCAFASITGTRHGYLRWTDICCDARFDIINRPFLVDGALLVLQVCVSAL